MKPPREIRHEFVDLAPKTLEEGVLYVSVEYGSSVHNCFCGCGRKVVTPFTPTDWKLTFDGDTVSLWPSVGNWDFPCESHYVIERNVVHWAPPMSREDIEAGRVADRWRKAVYHRKIEPEGVVAPPGVWPERQAPAVKQPWWKRLLRIN